MTIKKAIAIGILSSAVITLLAFGIKTNSFQNKLTTPNANKQRTMQVRADNTTLQNTKWILNNNVNTSNNITFNVNFISNSISYTQLEITFGYDAETLVYYNSLEVFNQNGGYWINQAYRTIEITSGNDISNANLISWLEENATQVDVTNLTNTTWTIKEIPNLHQNYLSISFTNINFTSNSQNFNGISSNPEYDYEGETILYNSLFYHYPNSNLVEEVYTDEQDLWANTNYRTISITDGSSATNPDLIVWLTENTTQEITPTPDPQPTPPDIEDGNFVTLQELMLNILTMPFTFIAQAFNVTLWPNTNYSFNLSNFILALIAIASILFIIKMFTSGFSIIGNFTQKGTERQFKRSQTKLNKAKTKQIKGNTPKKDK